MAKNINHIQHVRSSEVENGLPKLPSAANINEGELAINYAKGKETLSTKNSNGEIVTFSSDNYYSEKKLGSSFTNSNSAVTVTEVINGVNSTLNTHTANTEIHVTQPDKNKWDAVTAKTNQSDFTAHTANTNVHVTTEDKTTWNTVTSKANQSDLTAHTANTTVHVEAADKTRWNAVSGKVDTSAVTGYIDSVEYVVNGSAHTIVFYHGSTQIDSIDANAFIKDGMVDNVQINNGNLVVTFNTDAGKEAIIIPLTDIFDPSNYYTKDETDALLSAKTDVSDFNTLRNTVTAHTADTSAHVSTSDRTNWNAVSAKTNQSDFSAHTANTTIHVTADDKTNWNGKVDTSTFNSHTGNTDVHVTTGDKATWNTVTSKANQSDLNAHTSNEDIHVSASDKSIWNTVTNKANQSDLTAHTANTDVHVTTEDKATWNTVSSKANQSDLNALSATTTAHTADTTKHVTAADKTKWDAVTAKTNQTDFTAHTANTEIHVTAGDKSNWDAKVDMETMQVEINAATSGKAEQTDLNTLSGTVTAHTSDTTAHVSSSDRTNWDSVSGKASQDDLTAHTSNTSIHVAPADRTKWDAVTAKTNQTDFTAHTANSASHVSSDDRTKWNAVTGKTNLSDFTAHTANTDVHVTTDDKAAWNAKVEQSAFSAHTANTTMHVTTAQTSAWNAKVDVDTMNTAINEATSGKANQSDFVSHSGNTTMHVTADDKTKWNTVTSKASQSDLNTLSGITTAHTADDTIHVSSTDRTNWNGKANQSDLTAHTANTTVHVEAADKTRWNAVTAKTDISTFNAHTGNTDVHVTTGDKSTWNTVTSKVDTSAVTGYIDSVEYVVDGTAHDIVFYHGSTRIDSINANDFIKDGMVDNVQISGGNLVVTFNTDAGKDAISIPLSDIFNPDNYYTKTETDALLSAKTDVSTFNTLRNSVTAHTANTTIHVEAADKTRWNAVSAKTNQSDFSAHTANTTVHITSGERTTWNTVTSKANQNDLTAHTANTDVHVEAADKTKWNAVTAKTDISTFNAHTGNTDVHVTTGDKSTWNTVTSKANQSDLTAHTADTSAHVSSTDRTNWNGKANQSDLTAHTADSTVHVTAQEKEGWNAKLDASEFETFTGVTAPDTYLTIDEFDEVVGSGFTGETITDVILDNEMIVSAALNELNDIKQETLVSGVNIKTLNNQSLLGRGNIEIDPGSILPNAEVLSSITWNQIDNWDNSYYGMTAHTANTTIHVTSTDKTNWNNKVDQDYVDDLVGSGFTTSSITDVIISDERVIAAAFAELNGKIESGSTDALTAHTANTVIHVTQADRDRWDAGGGGGDPTVLTAHTANTAIHVTAEDKTNWNAKLSAVTFNGTAATVSNGVAAITATLDNVADGTTRKLSNYATTATVNTMNNTITSHTSSTAVHVAAGEKDTWNTVTSKASQTDLNTLSSTTTAHTADSTIHVTSQEKSTWNGKQDAFSNASVLSNISSTNVSQWNSKLSAVTFNGTSATVSNGVAAITATLDNVADGTTRKLSNYATTSAVNTHTATTIPSSTSSQMHLPTVTSADNGKILMVVNGQWALVSPTTIYTGTGNPDSSLGNNGDIYLQTT